MFMSQKIGLVTALQRRRIEAAEMKLLRPLAGYTIYRPQNKWLHTPRTADYRHTNKTDEYRRNWLSTLAKNATKTNPFGIIPLQTARKENNWKTEEALARAAVTVETERIKGSNTWYLWWWFPKEKKNLTIYSDLYDTFFSNKIVVDVMTRYS